MFLGLFEGRVLFRSFDLRCFFLLTISLGIARGGATRDVAG